MPAPCSDNSFTRMQGAYYEQAAHTIGPANHLHHNANPDYWDVLVAGTETGYRDKTALDFGCGGGRNLLNLWPRFARIDGTDLSAVMLAYAHRNLRDAHVPEHRYRLWPCDGVSLAGLPDASYDFVMSTLVLQHIPVWTIRQGLFEEFRRVLKPGGVCSLQLGFGEGYGRDYREDCWDAPVTNSEHVPGVKLSWDVTVTDEAELADDLGRAGFARAECVIRPAWSDGHPAWVYARAVAS